MSLSKEAWAIWPQSATESMDSASNDEWEGPNLWQSAPTDDLLCVVDTETTGFELTARMVEIAVARIRLPSCEIIGKASQLVNPLMPIPKRTQSVHHISDDMVRDKQTSNVVLPRFLNFIGKTPIAAHNAKFDRRILASELDRIGIGLPGIEVFDTMAISKKVLPKGSIAGHKLSDLIKHFNIQVKREHRALDDVLALVEVIKFLLAAAGGKTFRQLSGEPDKL